MTGFERQPDRSETLAEVDAALLALRRDRSGRPRCSPPSGTARPPPAAGRRSPARASRPPPRGPTTPAPPVPHAPVRGRASAPGRTSASPRRAGFPAARPPLRRDAAATRRSRRARRRGRRGRTGRTAARTAPAPSGCRHGRRRARRRPAGPLRPARRPAARRNGPGAGARPRRRAVPGHRRVQTGSRGHCRRETICSDNGIQAATTTADTTNPAGKPAAEAISPIITAPMPVPASNPMFQTALAEP